MIAFEEKYGIQNALKEAGYLVTHLDGNPILELLSGATPTAQDEANANDLIAAYDPIPLAKIEKITELKSEAAKRTNVIYGFMSGEDDETNASDVQAFYNFAVDIYTSIIPAARDTLAPRLQSFKDIRDTTISAIATINGLTVLSDIATYDVAIDPVW